VKTPPPLTKPPHPTRQHSTIQADELAVGAGKGAVVDLKGVNIRGLTAPAVKDMIIEADVVKLGGTEATFQSNTTTVQASIGWSPITQTPTVGLGYGEAEASRRFNQGTSVCVNRLENRRQGAMIDVANGVDLDVAHTTGKDFHMRVGGRRTAWAILTNSAFGLELATACCIRRPDF
jgi:hypothetical protein